MKTDLNINKRPVFNGYYFITDDGRLYSVRRDKYLQSTKDKYGYLYYVVSIQGIRTTVKAHRLVAEAFIPNPCQKPTVNHKNGVRTDNRVQNLEWATWKEQAHDPLTRKKVLAVVAKTDYQAMGACRNFGRKRVAAFKGNTFLGLYDSLKIAANKNNANYSSASECANGYKKAVGGVSFAYIG